MSRSKVPPPILPSQLPQRRLLHGTLSGGATDSGRDGVVRVGRVTMNLQLGEQSRGKVAGSSRRKEEAPGRAGEKVTTPNSPSGSGEWSCALFFFFFFFFARLASFLSFLPSRQSQLNVFKTASPCFSFHLYWKARSRWNSCVCTCMPARISWRKPRSRLDWLYRRSQISSARSWTLTRLSCT